MLGEASRHGTSTLNSWGGEKPQIKKLRRLGFGKLTTTQQESIKKRFCELSIFVQERLRRWFNKRRRRKVTL